MDQTPDRPTLRMVYDRFFAPSLPLQTQVFNLLGVAGIIASLAVGLISFALHAAANAVICGIIFLCATALIWGVEKRKLSRSAGARVIMTGVFILAFPLLFFTAGGYRSGMPSFFVFALIFTAVLAGTWRERAAWLLAEFAVYV
jgi:hypothetical protein